MASISFDLRAGRTADDLYKDTAITNGWKSQVEDINEVTVDPYDVDTFTAPDNMVEGSLKTVTTDEKVVATYQTLTMIDNPVTDIVFGEKIVRESFGLQDAELSGKAETLKAKQEYNV